MNNLLRWILLFFCSCQTQPPLWHKDASLGEEAAFRIISKNPSYIHLELLHLPEKEEISLVLTEFPLTEDVLPLSLFAQDTLLWSGQGAVLRGGMKIALPQEGQQRLLQALQEEPLLRIVVDERVVDIECAEFSSLYQNTSTSSWKDYLLRGPWTTR